VPPSKPRATGNPTSCSWTCAFPTPTGWTSCAAQGGLAYQCHPGDPALIRAAPRGKGPRLSAGRGRLRHQAVLDRGAGSSDRGVLRRKETEFSTSPSTRLPGNIAIERVLRQRIASGEPFAVCYADLDNFKPYNDYFGFLKGDGSFTRSRGSSRKPCATWRERMILSGTLAGTISVVVTAPGRADPICRPHRERVRAGDPTLLRHRVARAGLHRDPGSAGPAGQFPLMTLTLVIITNEYRVIEHPGQIGDIAAELKHKAKSIPGSTILRDQPWRARARGGNHQDTGTPGVETTPQESLAARS